MSASATRSPRALARACAGAAALALAVVAGAALALGPAPSSPRAASGTASTSAATPSQRSSPPAASAPAPSVTVVEPSPASDGARLWAYVDAGGTAHFAQSRLDSRYSLVLADHASLRVPGKKDGPELMLTWLEFSPDVLAMQPYLREAAAHSGVDPELLKAVIAVESRFNPKAVSKQGAVGLMQLTPVTADRYATADERQRPAAQRLLDARTNILTGARMLADLTHRYGSIDVALAAWNAGEGSVRRAGGRVPGNAETEAHVHLVLELYWALLQRSLGGAAHGLQLHEAH